MRKLVKDMEASQALLVASWKKRLADKRAEVRVLERLIARHGG